MSANDQPDLDSDPMTPDDLHANDSDPLDGDLRAIWTRPPEAPPELRARLLASLEPSLLQYSPKRMRKLRPIFAGALAASLLIALALIANLLRAPSKKADAQLSLADERFALSAVVPMPADDDDAEVKALYSLAAEP